MSFLYSKYLLLVFLFLVIFLVLLFFNVKKFNRFVENYWNYRLNNRVYLSFACYFIGFSLLLLSLLDLRGPEEMHEQDSSQQKTIILLDTSPSMLAEDVRPNRFNRSLFLMKHLVKTLRGHQISIVLFSDIQKRLIPFTEDVDLIEARISSLEKGYFLSGSTNLGKAIMESLNYFKEFSKDPYGNILVFTDAEETGDDFTVSLTDKISLGVIGIGTLKGSTIPIRTADGVFSGYKNFKGEPVITKLNEQFLKDLDNKVENFNYWIASSYDLPTNEIINFLNNSLESKKNKSSVTARPPMYHYLIIPALIFMILGYILKFGRIYIRNKSREIVISLFFILSLINPNALAQTTAKPAQPNIQNAPSQSFQTPNGQLGNKVQKAPTKEEIEEMERQRKELIQKELSILKTRKFTDEEREILAEKIKGIGGNKEYNVMMEEIYKGQEASKENHQSMFNLGTSQLENGNLFEGLKTLKNVDDYLANSDKDSALREDIKKNIQRALMVQQQQEQNQDSKDNNKDSQDGENSDQNKNDKNSKGDKDQDKDQEGDGKDKKDGDEKEQDKNIKNKKKSQKELKDSMKESEMKGVKKKLPTILKQLVDDDRKLQQEMLDTSTDNRKRGFEKKDW